MMADGKWSNEDVAAAVRLREDGLTLEQIGERIGRSTQAVAKKLRPRRPPKPVSPAWTSAQVVYLEANMDALSEDLAVALSRMGPARTPQAVLTKKRDIRAAADGPDRQKGGTPKDGWPAMRGSNEDRDEKFWRLVLREKLRLVRAANGKAA